MENQETPATQFLRDLRDAIKQVIDKHPDKKEIGLIVGGVEKISDTENGGEAAAVIAIHGNHKMLHILSEGMKEHPETGHFFSDGASEISTGGLFEILDKIFGVERPDKPKSNIRPEDVN